MSGTSKVVLVTGFPRRLLAARVVQRLLALEPDAELRCIVPADQEGRANALLAGVPREHRARVRLYTGATWAMDFGLSGREWNELAAEVTHIHHAGTLSSVATEREEALRENVDATREVLELATRAKRLEQLVHWSSATISGTRRGYVLEEELSLDAPARNPVEETLRTAERLLAGHQGKLPITVLRPAALVGDSRTGETDRLDGLYLLVLRMLSAPPDATFPVPTPSDMPLHIVPIDHAVEAGLCIALDARSRGRTHHVVDPDPLPVLRVFELVAQATGRRLARTILPTRVVDRIARLPGVGNIVPVPKELLDHITIEVVYDDHNAHAILAGTGLVCPALETYVGAMVRFVREQQLEPAPAYSVSP